MSISSDHLSGFTLQSGAVHCSSFAAFSVIRKYARDITEQVNLSHHDKGQIKGKKAFKLEALRRLQQEDKSVTELAFELGLRRNQLYLWQQQLEKAGPDKFAPKPGRKKQ